MTGAVPSTTVSVAELLVALPATLSTTQSYVVPLSDEDPPPAEPEIRITEEDGSWVSVADDYHIPGKRVTPGNVARCVLQLIINIDPDIRYEANPLEIARSTVTIIDIELPELTIPRPTQRNMAPIIELLIRKEIAEK